LIDRKKVLAIIPARSGSKGLSGKNIKLLAGKPLIARTIESAKKCKFIDKIIVSTESIEIAKIAEKVGAEIPFIRPENLSTDTAKSINVIFHTINWFNLNNQKFDIVILLQPTSPLRTADDINNAVALLFEKDAKAIVSVCEVEHHPYLCNTLPQNLNMLNFCQAEIVNKNRQELPIFYRLNGAIYIFYINYFIKNNGFYGKNTYAYIMPQERSIDIDTIVDFRLAELLISGLK